jgi:hypothetical protein
MTMATRQQHQHHAYPKRILYALHERFIPQTSDFSKPRFGLFLRAGGNGMEGIISCCFFVNAGSAIGPISQQRAAARRV